MLSVTGGGKNKNKRKINHFYFYFVLRKVRVGSTVKHFIKKRPYGQTDILLQNYKRERKLYMSFIPRYARITDIADLIRYNKIVYRTLWRFLV